MLSYIYIYMIHREREREIARERERERSKGYISKFNTRWTNVALYLTKCNMILYVRLNLYNVK